MTHRYENKRDDEGCKGEQKAFLNHMNPTESYLISISGLSRRNFLCTTMGGKLVPLVLFLVAEWSTSDIQRPSVKLRDPPQESASPPLGR